MSVKEYPNVVPFTYWVHPSNYLEVQDNIYIKKCEVTIKKQPYIMAIKLSGVYWVVWNHTRDFKIPPSSIWNHKYMISDQNCTTRSSITTLSFKSQFEIAEFSQYQYLIDLLAGSLKSGNKNLLHLCISLRGRRFKREGKGSFGKGSLYLFWNHTRDFNIERVRSASSIWNHKYELRPKLNGTKFNYNLITSILPAIWFVTLNEIWNLFGCAVLLFLFH